MSNNQTGILNAIMNALTEQMGYKAEIKTVEDREMLRFAAPLLGDDKGFVLIEICQFDYDETSAIFQIFSTMIPEPGPGFEKLRSAVNGWNLFSRLGAYGIFEQLGQLYHKYNVVVNLDESAESVFTRVVTALYICMDEMEYRLSEALAISSGEQEPESEMH
ncbi:MAG: hypothetical protein ACOYI3_05335 [Christensenellales bacterium]|jgi:hypothetical protein